MKPGQVVECFTVKGKDSEKLEVVFRYPRMSDAKEAMRFINKARDEADFLGFRRHETLASEKKFLAEQLKNMRQRKGLLLFVEISGEIVGDASIMPAKHDVSSHVCEFGIALLEEFTGLGIGTRLMKRVLQLAKAKTRFKIIESGFFSKNTRSKKLHAKFGFKQFGRFPKECQLRDGAYCDHIYLYKVIKAL